MRQLQWLAAMVLFAPAMVAQTEIEGSCTSLRMEWDGSAETYWKISNPSGPSDYFSVDLGSRASGSRVVAATVLTMNMGTVPVDGLSTLGIFADNSGGPALGAPISTVDPTASADPGEDRLAIDLPDVTLGSTLSHLVVGFNAADPTLWIGSDTNGTQFGHSYFSTDGYQTPAIPFTVNWLIGLNTIAATAGTFWVNGTTHAVIKETDTLFLLFVGACQFQPYMIFLTDSSGSLIMPASSYVLFTGYCSIDDAGTTGCTTVVLGCDVLPVGTTLHFAAAYVDCPSSRRVKVSPPATLDIEGDSRCGKCCFGQIDDGVLDSTIWKVQNPAGTSDYFNVCLGPAPSCVHTLTSVEISTWNFCVTPASWDEVGVYDAAPSSCTPLFPALSKVNGQIVPPMSSWSFPSTSFDIPDYVVTGAENFQVAAHWTPGDTCLWIGSDTDGIDGGSPCGADLTASYFTLDGYSTPALLLSGAAWMMKVDFQ